MVGIFPCGLGGFSSRLVGAAPDPRVWYGEGDTQWFDGGPSLRHSAKVCLDGAWIAFVATAIMFYYSVVMGWTILFFVGTLTGEFPGGRHRVRFGTLSIPQAGLSLPM
ncbi:MAG: hypothetical protein CM1200mP14_01040 [Gammaproteobacteria bacterium]|nr:MAG: hypothetical protein CM1200mP14_01040 [Gammaproteobacteria bacterium]